MHFNLQLVGRIGLLAAALVFVQVARADDGQTSTSGSDPHFRNGAVVCVSQVASEIGAEALKSGGTAVDAAVATAFALAVTYPAAGNIGGGGYMLIVPAEGGESTIIDFREVAPAAATRDMFVDPSARTF